MPTSSRRRREKMHAIERARPRQTNWMTQLVCGASSLMGIGQTVTTIASMARKRDLTAIWELDPLAAPPRSVQEELRGTPVAAGPEPQKSQLGDEATNDAYEERSILELQLKYAMRRNDMERVRAISRELRLLEDDRQQQALNHAKANGELRVGDPCFVLAKLVEWEWYQARLIGVRSRYPTLRVEYLSDLEGNSTSLALPQPRINHVPIEHVCLQPPEHGGGLPIVPPSTACVKVIDPFVNEGL